MPSRTPPKDVRRQSTVRIDTIPIILAPHRYNEHPAVRSEYHGRTKEPGQLEARKPSTQPRLPPKSHTRLPNADYKKPLPGRPVEITPLDHTIERHNGTTSNLDCLPHRLRISKQQTAVSPMQRIHELTRENGYLREELAMYKETRGALRDLQEKSKKAHQILNDALQDVSRKIARSERRLLDYWGVNIDGASEEAIVF